MNKYQKALNTIEHDLMVTWGWEKDLEQIMILQELVDKATPKKANLIGGLVGECPSCHKTFLGAVDYCLYCGQVLDWSEEENCDEE